MIRLLTTLAACAALLALAGCGGDDKTIPRDEGATIIRLLRDARDDAEDLPDKCDDLQRTATRVQVEVQALPRRVDADTRRTLSDGADNLVTVAQEECQGAERKKKKKKKTDTTETETTPTETAPPPTTTETEPPPTTTETEPETETEPQPDDGGTPPGGGPPPNSEDPGDGAIPPGQDKKGGKKGGKG